MNLRLLTRFEIETLYLTHVKKDDAFHRRYEKLPLHLNEDKWKWETHDFPRVMCLLDFRQWIEKHNLLRPPRLLCTSLSDPEILYLEPQLADLCQYDPRTEVNDLHRLNLPKKDYDFILFSQTLEHLYNPFVCLCNLRDHLRPGGCIFTSVPMINIPHMTPIHYWGVNPMGLAALFCTTGFEILEIGSWGNKKYIDLLFTTHKWPDYRALIDENGIIPNEPQNLCQCWILAKKPAT